MGPSAFLESAWRDFVYASRTFGKNKGFFAVAALSLALGIGANTAIFQLLNAVRLRTLPVPHAEQLVQLQIAKNEHCCSGNFSNRHPDFTYAQWEQIRAQQQAFSSLFAFGDEQFNLAESGDFRFANALFVSGDFFKTLQIRPLLGHLLTSADDHVGCGADAAVISYGFWQKQLAGDPNVLSKQVSLDGHRFDIAGVTPAGFFGVEVGKSMDVFVRGAGDEWRKQPSRQTASLVALDYRTAEAGLDGGAGPGAGADDFQLRLWQHNSRGLPARAGEMVHAIQTDSATGGRGRIVAAGRV